jgi:signal transduction histidine kinase
MLFQFSGFWVKTSQPIVGIFLSYYLVVPYRLIREYQKRFDYQKKNEILLQVEELKTNFLSLVTHDLKTPVARIQGLSEMLLADLDPKLTQKERANFASISASSDELNHFITSILELTKIESNEIHIRLASHDINQIIEKCIYSLNPLAMRKNIKITTQLEPLFSIQVDASLISKVISNLIDNAIKYSPEGSEILITSSEVGDEIEIKVSDKGIGMNSDEQGRLFTKFYRAKSTTHSLVSGSGLGLYLTRYFIAAHRGRVEVESAPDKGSTFKIFLPIKQPNLAKTIPNTLTRVTGPSIIKRFLRKPKEV